MHKHYLLTEENIALVELHISRVDYSKANDLMINRLKQGYLSEYDQNYLDHELREKEYVDVGMDRERAHFKAIEDFDISPFAIYDTSVIEELPEYFNDNWREYHGLL